jgi:hypothetical protein
MGILGHSAERRRKQHPHSDPEMSVLALRDPSISEEVWGTFEQPATPIAPAAKHPQEASCFAPPIPEWARLEYPP